MTEYVSIRNGGDEIMVFKELYTETRGTKLVFLQEKKTLRPSLKRLSAMNTELTYDLVSSLPEEFTIRLRGDFNLTDEQVVALGFLCHFCAKSEYSFLIWEIRLFLLDYCLKTNNALGLLVLEARYITEAEVRYFNLNSHRAEVFFKRNFPSSLQTALELLEVRVASKRRPKQIQRKRGYNDHGSLRHICSSAYLDARPLWEETLIHNEIEFQRTILRDTLDFLTGFVT